MSADANSISVCYRIPAGKEYVDVVSTNIQPIASPIAYQYRQDPRTTHQPQKRRRISDHCYSRLLSNGKRIQQTISGQKSEQNSTSQSCIRQLRERKPLTGIRAAIIVPSLQNIGQSGTIIDVDVAIRNGFQQSSRLCDKQVCFSLFAVYFGRRVITLLSSYFR